MGQPFFLPPPPPPPTLRRSAPHVAWVITSVAVVLVILFASITVLAVRGGLLPHTNQAYVAAIPGPGCDKGGGQWEENTSHNFTLVCQADGVLMTQQTRDGNYSEIFFSGRSGQVFPQSYHLSVHAAIVGGGPFTAVGLEAHNQAQFGGQIFEVAANGRWEIHSFAPNGTPHRLSIGFLAHPAMNYDLGVMVDGIEMTFAIDGHPVATVTDTAYDATASVGLALNDLPGDSAVAAAKYTHFAYTPGGAQSHSIGEAVATATARASQRDGAPYTAAQPGPGCDTGGAQWATPAFFGSADTQSACDAGDLVLSQGATATTTAGVRFYGWDGNFPPNYAVSATIRVDQLGGGCAGFFTRVVEDQGRYGIFICNGDGQWLIDRYDSATNQTVELRSGFAPVRSSYVLKATMQGATLTLAVNGQVAGTATDARYATTSYIVLAMFAGNHTAGSAAFSNFVYTPLA